MIDTKTLTQLGAHVETPQSPETAVLETVPFQRRYERQNQSRADHRGRSDDNAEPQSAHPSHSSSVPATRARSWHLIP